MSFVVSQSQPPDLQIQWLLFPFILATGMSFIVSQSQPPYLQIQVVPLYKAQIRAYLVDSTLDNSSCHFKYKLLEGRYHVLVAVVSFVHGTVPVRKQVVEICCRIEWKPLLTCYYLILL